MLPDCRYRWHRAGRLRVRPVQPADRYPLEQLGRIPSSVHIVDTNPGSDKQTGGHLALERDHRLIGALRYRTGRTDQRPGDLPWSVLPPIEERFEAARPPTGVLWVTRLLRSPDLCEDDWRHLLRDAICATTQRLGVTRALLAPAPAPTSANLSPAAFCQQLHHGAIDAPAVRPFLSLGFELRGWSPASTPNEPWRLLLGWSNPRLS